MSERLNAKQKVMIESMEASMGNVTKAIQLCGGKVSRASHYKWLEGSSKYREAIEEVNDRQIDRSETFLHINIGKKNQRAIEYHLDRQGAHRGYGKTVERCEVDLTGDELSQMDKIMKAMTTGKMSFQMGDRLMKGLQLKVDLREQILLEQRITAMEDKLNGASESQ